MGSTTSARMRLHERIVHPRHRADRAHAAGVRPRVTVVGLLEVRARRKNDEIAAVAQAEDRDFPAFEELFHEERVVAQDDGCRKRSAPPVSEDSRTPFPAASPLFFTTSRCPRLRRGRIARKAAASENSSACRGREIVSDQEGLGKCLAGFQPRSLLARADRGDALRAQKVHDTGGQGRLGADEHAVDAVLPGRRPRSCRSERGSPPGGSSPTCAVPAFPGPTNTPAPRGLLAASFQARACSRPPEPRTRTFMALPPGAGPPAVDRDPASRGHRGNHWCSRAWIRPRSPRSSPCHPG